MNYNDYKTLARLSSNDDLNEIITNCRCPKCVYEGTCKKMDIAGSCKDYKRDPPDGGYYG